MIQHERKGPDSPGTNS